MNRAQLGRIGEAAAAVRLEEMGYTVTGRNVRIGRDEIDLIAEDAEHICFVEVKTRRQYPAYRTREGTPAEAVNARKQAALIRAAEEWLAAHPAEAGSADGGKSPRIDVMEVYADPESDVFRILLIRHLPGAVAAVRSEALPRG